MGKLYELASEVVNNMPSLVATFHSDIKELEWLATLKTSGEVRILSALPVKSKKLSNFADKGIKFLVTLIRMENSGNVQN